MQRVVLPSRVEQLRLGPAVRGWIIGFGVPAPGAALDQGRPGAAAGAMDGLLGDTLHGDDVIAVDGNAREAVSLGAIAQVFVGIDGTSAVAVGLGGILNHADDRKPVPGGQAGSFVPESKSGQPIVGKCNHDVGFPELTVGESDSSSDVKLS